MLSGAAFDALREQSEPRGTDRARGARTLGDRLWRLASRWPKQSGLQPLVYRYVPASDEIAAEVFGSCDDVEWKRAILRMVWDLDEGNRHYPSNRDYPSTLALGMAASDGTCRFLAYGAATFRRKRYWSGMSLRDKALRWKALWAAWRGARKDTYALRGLGTNRSLFPRELRWMRSYVQRSSLAGMEKYDYWNDVEGTLADLRVEKEINKAKYSLTDESKVEWTQDQKLEFLTAMILGTSSVWWLIMYFGGIAWAVGLILGALVYVFLRSFPLSLLVFFSCLWLGGALPLLVARLSGGSPVPPWQNLEKWRENLRYLWLPPRAARIERILQQIAEYEEDAKRLAESGFLRQG